MAFPFLQRGNVAESARQLSLSNYVPSIVLENLVAGIDNIRHDVFLSPKFVELGRIHIFKLIVKNGNVEDLAAEDPSTPRQVVRPVTRLGGPFQPAKNPLQPGKESDPAEFRRLVTELHIAALNRA